MALNQLLQSVQAEADKELAQIQAAHAKERDALLSEWEGRMSKARDQALTQADRAVRQESDMERFAAESRLRQSVLTEKRRVLASVYEKALQKLSQLSDADYEAFLQQLFTQLPNEKGEIIPAKGKEAQTKKALHGLKRDWTIAKESVDAEGGFIWRSEAIEVDCRFATLLANIRTQTEAAVAAQLFV
ncbi:MAG: hypothetical protein H6760_03445 [Candidatus Nomurabacteria bacterium]|nr:MAG: hypothetical protein H6760_03445 [Candidatus Nomurabacteria bacterium]